MSKTEGLAEGNLNSLNNAPESSNSWKYRFAHLPELIISNVNSGVKTRSNLQDIESHFALLSEFEPNNVEDALNDGNWINAMQDELNQFQRNNV